MFKKFLVAVSLIIQNFTVASDSFSAAAEAGGAEEDKYEKFYTGADQTSFDNMQKIHEVAIQAAQMLGYDKMNSVANLWFGEEASKDQEPKDRKKIYFYEFGAARLSSQGFLLAKNQNKAVGSFDLISPFGISELATVYRRTTEFVDYTPDTSTSFTLNEKKSCETNRQFFENLKKCGLELSFKSWFYMDLSGFLVDGNREIFNVKTGEKVLAREHKGSCEYFTALDEGVIFYEITAVKDKKLPVFKDYLFGTWPPSCIYYRGIERGHFLRYGSKKYHDYLLENDLKRGSAAGGAGSEDLK